MIVGNDYAQLNNCDYLDSNIQSSSDMLLNCIGDKTSGQEKLCTSSYQKLYDNIAVNSENIAIKRGVSAGYGILPNLTPDKSTKEIKNPQNSIIDNVEGFTGSFVTDNGLGESYTKKGECPEGYKRCPKTNNCIQVCTNCKYNDKMKSQEFNEFDKCFPNGVYDGINSEGNLKCTCGKNNQYCSEKFVDSFFMANGSFLNNNEIKNFNDNNNFFSFTNL
tara:strand:- start:185 stop:841 length:657 start_codon:yes stop_codon:yes gene_type:complete